MFKRVGRVALRIFLVGAIGASLMVVMGGVAVAAHCTGSQVHDTSATDPATAPCVNPAPPPTSTDDMKAAVTPYFGDLKSFATDLVPFALGVIAIGVAFGLAMRWFKRSKA